MMDSEKYYKDNISTLRINRLQGRMLKLPPPRAKKLEILLVYGHHSSLERMKGLAENLNKYGAVTLPDLPGFGGMDSFYKIGLKPTIENYADYLASFIKLRYKRKRLAIIAISFSFPIVTRMLQKYPEIVSKVDLLVSSVGFVHHDDFNLPAWQQLGLRTLGNVCDNKIMSTIFRYTMLQAPVIRANYRLSRGKHSKMNDADNKEFRQRVDAEIVLWQINDVQTRMRTMSDMFSLNVCDKKVDLKVFHVSVANDRYFDNHVVQQHMRVIYKDFEDLPTTVPGHMPSIVSTAKEAEPFVPDRLKKILRQKG